MLKRINVNVLKKLIREQVQKLLIEEKEKKELEDSLDNQIDDYFMEYESEAKIKKNEGFNFHSMTRGFLSALNEAEDDEKEQDKKDDEEKQSEAKLTAEDIDVEEFAAGVVRLIDNYDSLLEIRNTISRRAINFLTKNYEQDVVNEFKIVLEDQHDIVIGQSTSKKEDEFEAPSAARSGGTAGV